MLGQAVILGALTQQREIPQRRISVLIVAVSDVSHGFQLVSLGILRWKLDVKCKKGSRHGRASDMT